MSDSRNTEVANVAPAEGSSHWPSPIVGWYSVSVLMLAYIVSYVDRQILTQLVRDVFADLLPSARLPVLYDVSWPKCRHSRKAASAFRSGGTPATLTRTLPLLQGNR